MKILNHSKRFFSFDRKIILIAFCGLFLASQVFAQRGRLDLSFQNVLQSGSVVRAIEVQTDGKVLVGGNLATGGVFEEKILRLNADGSIDPTFVYPDLNIGTAFVQDMRLQTDGKIVARLGFGKILRFNTDGSVDATYGFNGRGVDAGVIFSFDIQTDNKIIISEMNAIGNAFVTRFNTSGVSETGVTPFFRANTSGSEYRGVTFVPAENKILVSGMFTHTVNNVVYRNLLRLNLDGTVDPTFTPNVAVTFDSRIKTTPLPGGKILVWGKPFSVNEIVQRGLAVLNNDGSLDASFNPATSGAENILKVAVQSNGKIIIAGSNFTSNTFLRGNVARLNADGSIDTTFNQGRGAKGEVQALKIRSNNKLLIGGTFFRYHIFPRGGLAQINL